MLYFNVNVRLGVVYLLNCIVTIPCVRLLVNAIITEFSMVMLTLASLMTFRLCLLIYCSFMVAKEFRNLVRDYMYIVNLHTL